MTPLQKQTLQAVAHGEVDNRNHGYSAWRIVGASPQAVGALIKRGLVRWPNGWNGVAQLTDQGREVLAELGEGA